LLNATQNVVVEGGLTGTGSIDKWGGGTLALLGDSTSYSGNIRVYQGALQVQNGNATTVTPQLGAGMFDVMPGAILRITSPLAFRTGAAATVLAVVATALLTFRATGDLLPCLA
jgi:autotransporter-associated beta strand protein